MTSEALSRNFPRKCSARSLILQCVPSSISHLRPAWPCRIRELFLGPTRPIDPREINPAGAHPAVITMAALYGSVRVAETVERVAASLNAAYQSFRLPWWLVVRDFIRGGLLLQLEPGPNLPESSVTAFVYLKVSRCAALRFAVCSLVGCKFHCSRFRGCFECSSRTSSFRALTSSGPWMLSLVSMLCSTAST